MRDCLDHLLQDGLIDAGFKIQGESNKRDRVLWLWLSDRHEFEELERLTIFNKLYS